MRALSLSGFLSAYVKELASANTLSVSKLYKNMKNANHRLKEPLFLYCLYSGKSDLLMKYLTTEEREEFTAISDAVFQKDYSSLPIGYQKVYEAYEYQSNRHNNETRIKALMADKIVKLKSKKNVTNYRIYTDLRINAGNFNDFIKNRKYNKLSLNKSREIMNYLERL